MINLGLSGFVLSGADVGGFAGSPSPETADRWIQLAAFQPIVRDHAAKGTRAPRALGRRPEHEDIRRRYIEERYRLMPYLYTVAEETSRTGLPIMRPLFLEFPHATTDGHPSISTRAASSSLVRACWSRLHPHPKRSRPTRSTCLPAVWYDYWTGERLDRRGPTAARDLEQRDAQPGQAPDDHANARGPSGLRA